MAPCGPRAVEQWAQAYSDLESEFASPQRDNEALLAEVMGRRRAQHGKGSERVSPENLLSGLRRLMETEPTLVPDGMLEELEQECAERARRREGRQAAQPAKLKRRADAAARQAVDKHKNSADPDGDDDDDGGGGGGASATADKPNGESSANVIPLRSGAGPRRNTCLDGILPTDPIQPVGEAALTCPHCLRERHLVGYQDSLMLDICLPQLRPLRIRQEKRACSRHPEGGVVMAPAAGQPLPQSLPTALLLATCPWSDLAACFSAGGPVMHPPRWATGFIAPPISGPPSPSIWGSKFWQVLFACTQTAVLCVSSIPESQGAPRKQVCGDAQVRRSAPIFASLKTQASPIRARNCLSGWPYYDRWTQGLSESTPPESREAVAVVHGVHLNCWAHARRPFEQALRLDEDLRVIPVIRWVQRLYKIEGDIAIPQ